MDTDVMGVVPPELRAKIAPPDVEARLTVAAPLTGLPNGSSSCTVIRSGPGRPRLALADATPVRADVVKTNLAAGAGLTTNEELVAGVNPFESEALST